MIDPAGGGNELLDAALRYADRGWQILPVHGITEDGECTCGGWCDDDDGKHPRTDNGLKDATDNPEQIREWWGKWPRANIAVATGAESGIVVFDVDDLQATLDDIGHRKLPKDGVRARTGKGRHFYFQHPGEGEEMRNNPPDTHGWDFRGDGGYVILPPSRHASGNRYRWQNNPDDGELYPPPDWLPQVLAAKRRGDEPSKAAGPVAETIPEGQRNNALTSYAGTLRRRGANEDEIYAALQAMNEHRCNPPLRDREVRRIAESIASYEAGDPITRGDRVLPDAPTPEGALKAWAEEAEVTARTVTQALAEAAERWRHVVALADTESLWWHDDGIWKPLGEHPIAELLDRALPAEFRRERVRDTAARLRARCRVERDDMGTPQGTIAVANGLLDTTTRDLRPLDPDHRAIRRLPIEFDAGADAPRWREFLQEVVPDEDDRDALAEFVGYTLLAGEVPWHRALMLLGTGANGKSTFLRVVEGILGDQNLSNHSLHELSDKTFARADLFGALANIHADLAAQRPSSWSVFKTLVGGDRIAAERKHEPAFSFRQTAKLMFSANRVPEAPEDAGEAFYRRWLIVEFSKTIPPDDRDPHLAEKLVDESAGVLNWALDGLDRLRDQGGFTGAPDAEEAEEIWIAYGSPVHRFALEVCEAVEGAWTSSRDVYTAYKKFCSDRGFEPEPQQTITKNLKRIGSWTHYNHRERGRGFSGLALNGGADR